MISDYNTSLLKLKKRTTKFLGMRRHVAVSCTCKIQELIIFKQVLHNRTNLKVRAKKENTVTKISFAGRANTKE